MSEIIRVTHRLNGETISVTDWKIVNGVLGLLGSVGHLKPIMRLISGWSLEDAVLNVDDAFALSPDSVLFTESPVEDKHWVDDLFNRTNQGGK